MLPRAEHPELIVTLREATTPALVRPVRAGTLDLASSPRARPIDHSTPSHPGRGTRRPPGLRVGSGNSRAFKRTVGISPGAARRSPPDTLRESPHLATA